MFSTYSYTFLISRLLIQIFLDSIHTDHFHCVFIILYSKVKSDMHQESVLDLEPAKIVLNCSGKR